MNSGTFTAEYVLGGVPQSRSCAVTVAARNFAPWASLFSAASVYGNPTAGAGFNSPPNPADSTILLGTMGIDIDDAPGVALSEVIDPGGPNDGYRMLNGPAYMATPEIRVNTGQLQANSTLWTYNTPGRGQNDCGRQYIAGGGLQAFTEGHEGLNTETNSHAWFVRKWLTENVLGLGGSILVQKTEGIILGGGGTMGVIQQSYLMDESGIISYANAATHVIHGANPSCVLWTWP